MRSARRAQSMCPPFRCVCLQKPSELVTHLDRYIVGQFAAKKSVAVALRNRWRRHSVRASLRPDITPKNILMVGPTGCGQFSHTERRARCLSIRLCDIASAWPMH